MAWNSWVLPSYFVCVFPQLYLSIIRAWSDQILAGMEADPVDSSFMAVEYFNALDLNSDEVAKVFGLGQFLS